MQNVKKTVALREKKLTFIKNKERQIFSPFNTQKGVTLIALVVTIAILIILSGITINIALGENGILKSTKEFSNKVQETQNQKNEELVNSYEELEMAMNDGKGKPIIASIIWNNGKASLTLTATISGYTIYYKLESNEYTIYTDPITNLAYGDSVEVKLTKENRPDRTLTVNIIDNVLPTANITLDKNATSVGEKVIATVTHIDNESGVNIASCKYIYNQIATKIGTTSYKWNSAREFSSNAESIELTAYEPKTYYLHILTVDKANNKTETISQAVTVEGSTP